VGAAALNGIYGSFAFDALTGAWSYTLDNDRASTQALNRAERVVETLRVTSLDGTATRDIRATVVGTNDRATISGTAKGAVAEDGTLTAGGTLRVADADAGQAAFATPASPVGTYGTFAFNAGTGAWGYTLDNAAAQALHGGETATDTLTVASLDGTDSQVITVSIAGSSRIDLATFGAAQGFVIKGETASDLGGVSVSAGDVNGDGFADLILGAPLGDDGGIEAGEALGQVAAIFSNCAGLVKSRAEWRRTGL